MKTKADYSLKQWCALVERYRVHAIGSTGTHGGRTWFQRGIENGKKSERIDQENYEYYYDLGKHYEPYERKGKAYFKKAAKCFQKSAAYGNDLGMMHYGMYLYVFENRKSEAFPLFQKASELGLAIADYALYECYLDGADGIEQNTEKAEFHKARFYERCECDERQAVLSWGIDPPMRLLRRTLMYAWFSGEAEVYLHDTPRARESRWKYE